MFLTIVMSYLSILALERICHKVGIKRISRSALVELRFVVEEKAIEIARRAVEVSEHCNRNTVLESDVDFVTQK